MSENNDQDSVLDLGPFPNRMSPPAGDEFSRLVGLYSMKTIHTAPREDIYTLLDLYTDPAAYKIQTVLLLARSAVIVGNAAAFDSCMPHLSKESLATLERLATDDEVIWMAGRMVRQSDTQEPSVNDGTDALEPVGFHVGGGLGKFTYRPGSNGAAGVLTARGANMAGELGLGHRRMVESDTKVDLPKNVIPKVIASSHGSTVLVSTDGRAWVAGLNDVGQLGLPVGTEADSFTRITLPDLAVDAVTAYGSTFIRLAGGGWVAAGSNEHGQLFMGHANPAPRFAPIASLFQITRVFTACGSTWMIGADDRVFACGLNDRGQLGVGMDDHETIGPMRVQIDPIASIASNDGSTFFLLVSGDLMAVGRNDTGQLGLGHTMLTLQPTLVVVRDHITTIQTGGGTTVAHGAGGWVGWGLNASRLLADSDRTVLHMPTPTDRIRSDATAVQLTGGTLIVRTPSCTTLFGNNDYGQLGGKPPVTVKGLVLPFPQGLLGGMALLVVEEGGLAVQGDKERVKDLSPIDAYKEAAAACIPAFTRPVPAVGECVAALKLVTQAATLTHSVSSEVTIDEFHALRKQAMTAFAACQHVANVIIPPGKESQSRTKAAQAKYDAVQAAKEAVALEGREILKAGRGDLKALAVPVHKWQREIAAMAALDADHVWAVLMSIESARELLRETLSAMESAEASGRGQLCIICCDKVADHAYIPCGHRSVCEDCVKKTAHTLKRCPICRLPAEQIVRIYNAGLFSE
ncbi:zinc finger protein [Carpediemonas membranifera]|uniref:Zinc finger protein n=1 Tax=Carpediemonas membranifera TaxID=201153 RepID=A0A8J6B7Y7_9EUKA|nr:zinc finger protein [Carpediemonas membranifera]|eukprot:KAG9395024.1 zinc finger protein [Carpediemonas membranifera]